MVRLPTIHMYHKDLKPPFDVAPHRAIPFARDDYVDLETAQADLKSAVEEVIKPGFVVENPITHARGVINVSEHASPEQRVVLDRLEALERQFQEFVRSIVHLPHPQGGIPWDALEKNLPRSSADAAIVPPGKDYPWTKFSLTGRSE